MLNNLLGFIVMIGKSDEGMIAACWLCCCWCCFYSLMIGREFDAGCKSTLVLELIVLPVCWLDRQLVDLVFSWMIWSLVSSFGLHSCFFWDPSYPLRILIFDLISVFGFHWEKVSWKGFLMLWWTRVEHILSCSWCLVGVGPVICRVGPVGY